MLGHYYWYDTQKIKMHLSQITKLTHMLSPSLSVKYYEPRILFYEVAMQPSYPEMPVIDKMDFVYEK